MPTRYCDLTGAIVGGQLFIRMRPFLAMVRSTNSAITPTEPAPESWLGQRSDSLRLSSLLRKIPKILWLFRARSLAACHRDEWGMSSDLGRDVPYSGHGGRFAPVRMSQTKSVALTGSIEATFFQWLPKFSQNAYINAQGLCARFVHLGPAPEQSVPGRPVRPARGEASFRSLYVKSVNGKCMSCFFENPFLRGEEDLDCPIRLHK